MNIASPQEVIHSDQIEIRYLLEGAVTHGARAVFKAVIPPSVRVPDCDHLTR